MIDSFEFPDGTKVLCPPYLTFRSRDEIRRLRDVAFVVVNRSIDALICSCALCYALRICPHVLATQWYLEPELIPERLKLLPVRRKVTEDRSDTEQQEARHDEQQQAPPVSSRRTRKKRKTVRIFSKIALMHVQ